MMKKKIAAMMLCGVMVLSVGCTKSNIMRPGKQAVNQPDFTIVEDVKLDWNQIGDDLMEYYTDTDEYPGLVTYHYVPDEENQMITVQVFVDDTVSAEDAAKYGSDMVKNINDCVMIQNYSITAATDESYGGYFQKTSATVQVIPEATKEDESTWLVNQVVEAGTDTPIAPLA